MLRLVRICHAQRTHFVDHGGYAAICHLPCGFSPGQAAADNVDRLHVHRGREKYRPSQRGGFAIAAGRGTHGGPLATMVWGNRACGRGPGRRTGAAAKIDEQLAEQYEQQSVALPTPRLVVVCHGFACKFRTEIGLDDADSAALRQLMAPGTASPEAERAAAANAVAWFERRFAPEAGTSGAKARAGPFSTGDRSQIDCI